MNAWPSIKTLLYDGWIIRLSEGYGNRANSVNPIYPSKIGLEEKIDYCDQLFARHNLPANYKLVRCEEHKAIEEKLDKLNYQTIHETSIQICQMREIPERGIEGITAGNDFSDPWIQGVIDFNKIEHKNIPMFKKIIGNIASEKIVVQKKAGGKVIGCGYGAIENGFVGVFDIVVKEDERGKGYGRQIVEAILREAYKRGIRKSYLQVMLNNKTALGLYEKLGYREIYQYWYRKKMGGES